MSKKVDDIMDEIENPEASERTGAGISGRQAETARRERTRAGSTSSPFARLGQFLRDVRAELKRVSWPSASDVKNTTIITLVAVIFFSTYLFAIDQAWARLINGLDWLLLKVIG